MNWYKRHIGDYIKDAAHLSLLEHGVYTRLLDVYYTRETGIPDDQAARLIGARSKDEREALTAVLSEFFELKEGTWIQQRCEKEIAIASDVASTNREIALQREAKKRAEKEAREQHEPSTKRGQSVQRSVHEPTTSQTPDSISHKPDTSKIKNQELSSTASPEKQQLETVFDHWRGEWNHPDAKLDPKRTARIRARLKNFTPQQLCDAISGFKHSDWHTGRDPSGGGKIFDGIQTLLRDDEQVETGLRLFLHPPQAPPDKKFLSAVERVKLANGTGAKSDERVVSEQRSQQGIHNLDMLGGDVREPANTGVRRLGS